MVSDIGKQIAEILSRHNATLDAELKALNLPGSLHFLLLTLYRSGDTFMFDGKECENPELIGSTGSTNELKLTPEQKQEVGMKYAEVVMDVELNGAVDVVAEIWESIGRRMRHESN